MKLLIFVNKFNSNDDLLGFFVGWVEELLKNGNSVIIIAQETGRFGQDPNLKVITIDKKRNKNKLKRFWMFNKLLFGLRKNYDSVLVIMAPGWTIAGFPVAMILKKKLYLWYAVWRSSWKLKIAEKVADGIFCSVRSAFPFESKKVSAVGQGIDTDYFTPNNSIRNLNKLTLLGRISPVKKIETFFYALKHLRDSSGILYNLIQVDLVGDIASPKDKKYLSTLKKISRDLEIEDKINWVGRVPHCQTRDYYQNSDIFINLTPAGSFDKTMLEAMACEDLVLASNPALAAFMDDKLRRLFIFKEGDATDLAEKLECILNLNRPEKDDYRGKFRDIIINSHSQKLWAKNLQREMK